MEKLKRYQRSIRQKTLSIFAYTECLNKVDKLCENVLLRKVANY